MQRHILSLHFLVALLLIAVLAVPAFGQYGSQGRINVTVLDPDGRVVPQAHLELQDLATNDVRTAETQESGNYTFINLSIGTYKLTISKTGFDTQVFSSVVVQATRTTDLEANLKIGATAVTVEVSGTAAPLVEATSSAIGTTVDLKQIENLPLQARNLFNLARLTPGYTGTWNGMPTPSQGNNFDGVISVPTRAKYQGVSPAAQARIEAIEEMTVQTDAMDLNQGFGQTTMQVNFVTRRGTNAFHGRIFEDFRNDALNAWGWLNKARKTPKDRIKLNEFGGAIGGPILKDKLFFFGSFSMSKQPGTGTGSNNIFTNAAQAGNFTYGNGTTVNLFTLAGAYNSANGTTLPTAVNANIASLLSKVNTAASAGTLAGTSDPNLQAITWLASQPRTGYYPTIRIDYNVSNNLRMNLSYNRSKNNTEANYLPTFPGSGFTDQVAGIKSDNYTAGYGLDWTISPTLINQFKAGFLYYVTRFGTDAKQLYATNPMLWFGYPGGNDNMSGQTFILPTTRYYPVISASDTMTWQKGAHRFSFGFSFYRENDHYWNPPAGFPNVYFGIDAADPASNAFTNGTGGTIAGASDDEIARAQQLYAILTGRISWVQGEYKYDPSTKNFSHTIGAYNLNELSKAFGLFFQDSYRIRPNITINYGLRWDFTGDNYDKTNAYHSAYPDSIYGPSGINNLFNPGSLLGNLNPKWIAHGHVYHPWNVSPQPMLGVVWNPNFSNGWLKKMFGGDSTVIRAGYSLRHFTEPYQYYWDVASNYGAFFYQRFVLQPNNTGAAGTFAPGSISLGQSLPTYSYSPATYQTEAFQSEDTFINAIGVNGMNPNIRQPYTQSWNFGIQRKLGDSRALEVRYNGNRTIHQWIAVNPNEVNIFENGFLDEFKHAQANMAINAANGFPNSFANNGFAGQYALPIFTTAFFGEGTSAKTGPVAGPADFSSSTFLSYMRAGRVGSMANTLAGVSGTVPYFCNLVGSSFSPCVNNIGYSSGPGGYPINFFQANPYAAGASTGYMTDLGYANYHALQVELRQKPWHGLTLNGNYTFSKNLGIATPDDWTAAFTAYTLRNLDYSYGPTRFDLNHVIRIYGTYDLPFGRNRTFLNQGGVVDKVFGGWTLGTIVTRQSGFPFRLTGNYRTFNDYGDSGIVLKGVTPSQLQDAVGVYHVNASQYAGTRDFVQLINPSFLKSVTGGANSAYFAPNTTPGTIGQIVDLHGPGGYYQDLSLAKTVNITERVRFNFQSEFLNVWNHPVWANSSYNQFPGNVQSSGFGISRSVNAPRNIEFRANIEF